MYQHFYKFVTSTEFSSLKCIVQAQLLIGKQYCWEGGELTFSCFKNCFQPKNWLTFYRAEERVLVLIKYFLMVVKQGLGKSNG